MRHANRRRWLLVRNGAIGDTILLSSVIQTIRRNELRAWIEVMGIYERVELLVGEGLADAAVSSEISGMERLYADSSELPSSLKTYFSTFDVILFFTGGDHAKIQERLQLLTPGEVHVFPALPPPGSTSHCCNHYHGILHDKIPVESIPLPRLSLKTQDKKNALEFLRDQGMHPGTNFLLAMHPGAGSSKKQAPHFLFAEIASAYHRQFSISCLLIQGPADETAVTRVHSQLPEDLPVLVLKEIPLRDLASILSHADTMVGNDSGVAHLSAAVGCPTLVWFLQSDPKVWSPLGFHVRTMRVLL